MMVKLTFCIVVLVHTTSAIAASAVAFYHKPSHIVLEPKVNLTDTLDFGFAMGYQESEQRLVIGAPHADQVGRVYGCHIEREPNKTICEQLDIDVKKLASDYDKNNTEQKFYLGATIAATSKNFFTCAPLWTTSARRYEEMRSGTYGTCFAYYKKDNVQRIQGLVEQHKNNNDTIRSHMFNTMYGGIGWSSLADEKNKVILMGKPFDVGDIQYITHLELNKIRSYNTSSLSFRDEAFAKSNIRQFGYALAAGNFFDNKTMYACSVQFEKEFYNGIMFLVIQRKRAYLLKNKFKIHVSLISKEVGDFFGASLLSADISADSFTDLLVGAPAHSILGVCETGALYIYLNTGEKKYDNMKNNWLRVESDKARSRFGTAIASSDLDGDMKAEIFVSAPYEDFGAGAVYILSGDEVLQKMTSGTLPHSLSLKDLRRTQRIQKTDFKSFGFSLQVVPNINNNGCDGLAVGTPQSGSVTLLQCVPTIDAFLSIDGALNEVVKSTNTSFTVKVCIRVVYHTKSEVISTKFQVTTEVYGKGPRLARYKFTVDLSDKKKMLCGDVIVALRHNEDIYNFKSELGYLNEELFHQKEFDPSWVRLSDHSQLQSSTAMRRTCDVPTDCIPKLDMKVLWGGSNTVKEFYVEERTKETVTLLIENFGANAYNACVSIKVTGAEEHIQCEAIKDKDNVITCGLPSPVERNSNHNLSFVVDINKVTNVNDAVHIKAELFADCLQSKAIPRELDVKFIFAMKKVYIADGSHSVTVTEEQKKKEINSLFVDKHEYKIVNNASLLWENLAAVIHVPKKTFVQNYSILLNQEGSKCIETDTAEFMEFLCTGVELSNKPISIYLRTTIPYINITENLKIDSSIELRMASSNNTLNFPKKSQTTIINYVKDEAVIGNNKTAVLIIVLVTSIVILLVVAAILYKVGFFKRKELSRLDSFKASVKSKKSQSEGDSQLPPNFESAEDLNTDSKEDSMEDFDIEVVDDSPFEAVPLTVDDEAALIVEDKPPPKSRTKSSSSQLDKRENKRKASTASHTAAADKESIVP